MSTFTERSRRCLLACAMSIMGAAGALAVAQSAFADAAYAQGAIKTAIDPEDFGGVMVTVFVPDDDPSINARSQTLLSTRLGQVASSGGLSGVGMRTRFIMFPRVTVLDATPAGGLEKTVTASVEVTFAVRNYGSRAPVHQWTTTVAGTGRDEAAAVTQALSTIRPDSPALQTFAKTVHDRIVSHYEQNCAAIRQEARVNAQAGRANQALSELLTVPVDAASCHSAAMTDASKIAVASEGTDCTRRMREAHQRKIDGDLAGSAEILVAIGPHSACEADANNLTRELDQSATARENQRLQVQLATIHQQHTAVVAKASASVTTSASSTLITARVSAAAYFNSDASRVMNFDRK